MAQRIIKDDIRDNSREYRIYNKFGEYRVLLLDNVLYNSKHYNVLLYNVRDNSRQYSVLLQITPEIILDSTTYYYRHDV